MSNDYNLLCRRRLHYAVIWNFMEFLTDLRPSNFVLETVRLNMAAVSIAITLTLLLLLSLLLFLVLLLVFL